ncbi:zinc finger protein 227-like isoform X2 [Brienomyrus brachyistius]|uniref:zinc finger protein 227-like isoform X2 n=1 Tax=Brienomyrus brachyistius TaxID=42636 RepID=UPI0020B41DEF|nr:zinc finger protein 227-like isoform X2 [Brienomyrus brachyistius]
MSEAILTFQAQLSGVMETVFKAAMYEIVRLVEDSFLEEVSRSREQVETLKKRLQWSESKRKERETSGRARCAECGRAGAEADVGQTEDRSPGPAHGVTENRGLKQEGAQEIKWAGCPREDVEPLTKVLNQEAVLSTDKLSEEITSYPNLQQAVHVEGDKLKKEGFQLAAGSPGGPERWPVSLEEAGNPGRLHGDFGERQAQCSAEDWAPSSGPASQQPLKVHLPYGASFDTEAICGLEDALRTEAKAPCFAPVFDVRELGSQVLQDAFGAPARMQTELEGVRVDERAPVLPGPLRSRRAACSNQQGAPSLSPHGDVDVGELNYLLINEDGYLQDAGDGFWGQGQLGPVDGGERSQKRDQDPMAVDRSGELNSERLHAAPTGVRERPRSCAQCRVSFPDSASLKAHMSTHKASTAYTCTQCGKSFTQACNLKVHQRIHSRDGLHLCSHCGKGFVAFSDLKKHKCSHAGDKPYCCMLCGNKFSRLWNLKLHRRIHTQEKPHRCTQCEKSFTRADILKVHQRTHTGERPYCCTLCGLSFKRLDHLKSHQRKHKPQQT